MNAHSTHATTKQNVWFFQADSHRPVSSMATATTQMNRTIIPPITARRPSLHGRHRVRAALQRPLRVDWLPAEGYNVFAFDYRGYGKSAGRPTRQGLHEDLIAALESLSARPSADAECIVVFAQS
ncbi:MAG: hypothetical protein WD226_04920 [Planctomycetota bacterium]